MTTPLMETEFTVLGPPQPWQRAGTTKSGKRYTKLETKRYQAAVRNVAALECGADWPKHAGCRYAICIRAVFEDRRRRDLDNVAKSVLDALNGVGYEDDSQLDRIHIWRVVGPEPLTHVTLQLLEVPDQRKLPRARGRRGVAAPLPGEPVPEGYVRVAGPRTSPVRFSSTGEL